VQVKNKKERVNYMDIETELNKIWIKNNSKNLPQFLIERGFVFAENSIQKDILITGINPSFRNGDLSRSFGFNFQNTLHNEKYDNYWGPIKKMLLNEESAIDLRKESAYLDILYFREQEQSLLKKVILKTEDGLKFIIDQINLSQHIIEKIIKPKVIIIKNKESQAYWGRYSQDGIYWMGYEFELVENLYCGDLYKIKGLHSTTERIGNEILKTNLKNTFVLFSHHINQYTSKEKRLKPETIKDILEKYNTCT
jgi:hypothetical protein